MSSKKIDEETGVETTGHSWNGIEELNNPLPRWWLWCFYGTVAWGLVYTILYPAWPLLSGATPGLRDWSTRANVATEIAEFEDSNAPLNAKLEAIELAALESDADLNRYAVSAGASVFRNYCSQCHGSGAAGALGYPNLLDDDWLWGGDMENIALTIRHGIRNDVDPDARYSEMPAFSELLEETEVASIVQHVMAIAGQDHDATLAADGAVLFDENCSSCHGVEGMGDRELGAPNLTDRIWLYGGSEDALTYTINNARFGVMPNWSDRLSEAEVRAVAAYVHQLGGGEAPLTE